MVGGGCVGHRRRAQKARSNLNGRRRGRQCACPAPRPWAFAEGSSVRRSRRQTRKAQSSRERSLWLRRITCDGDGDGDYSDEDPGQELFFCRSFVVLDDRQGPTYLDCGDLDRPDTATGIFERHDFIRTFRLALVERLRLWHRALELGVWPAGPAEQWATDEARAAQSVPEARSGGWPWTDERATRPHGLQAAATMSSRGATMWSMTASTTTCSYGPSIPNHASNGHMPVPWSSQASTVQASSVLTGSPAHQRRWVRPRGARGCADTAWSG